MRHFFLFVNGASGGNQAARFLSPGIKELRLVSGSCEHTVHIFDIKEGQSGNKPGFVKLKQCVDRGDNDEGIFAIACGGDGTVMWMMQEMWEHSVTSAVVGVVPFGTGNDFARALNWHVYNAVNPWTREMSMLLKLIDDWTQANRILHDIWRIEASVLEGGKFLKVDSSTKKKVDLGVDSKSFLMSNYFSIGLESRIGVNFDRRRKNNQVRNKFVYFEEGFKKVLFNKTEPVDKTVSRMSSKDQVIFDQSSEKKLQPQTMSLVGINIPSFGGGMSIWENARPKFKSGITGLDPGHLSTASQVVGDGKLEWVSFHSAYGLGSEKVIKGRGYRIHQSGGPFVLDFFNDIDPTRRIYFEVDGEYFVFTRPKQISISHHKQVKTMMRLGSDSVIPQKKSSGSSQPQADESSSKE